MHIENTELTRVQMMSLGDIARYVKGEGAQFVDPALCYDIGSTWHSNFISDCSNEAAMLARLHIKKILVNKAHASRSDIKIPGIFKAGFNGYVVEFDPFVENAHWELSEKWRTAETVCRQAYLQSHSYLALQEELKRESVQRQDYFDAHVLRLHDRSNFGNARSDSQELKWFLEWMIRYIELSQSAKIQLHSKVVMERLISAGFAINAFSLARADSLTPIQEIEKVIGTAMEHIKGKLAPHPRLIGIIKNILNEYDLESAVAAPPAMEEPICNILLARQIAEFRYDTGIRDTNRNSVFQCIENSFRDADTAPETIQRIIQTYFVLKEE